MPPIDALTFSTAEEMTPPSPHICDPFGRSFGRLLNVLLDATCHQDGPPHPGDSECQAALGCSASSEEWRVTTESPPTPRYPPHKSRTGRAPLEPECNNKLYTARRGRY
jgi:hypothetical protein